MAMERYRDLGGNAGIAAYEIQEEAIVIRFKDGGTYLYDGRKPGRHHVEAMKRLARAGRGLTAYVNRHVRGNYAARLEARGISAPRPSDGRRR
ncbi:MAG TPA: hypothetical protein VHA35_02775 [Dongiaceae bacterium]|jgi:hypothetical protein|nr:hypothetical protein [Dongiaceae bacterium]